ncbi:MAG TPA: radical SAM protein [Anaeromyxobacter sp.]|nr:radical SAM protein [Anaeromyxobacter sp.]
MTDAFEPAYLALQRRGALAARAADAVARLASCDLCARSCRADRIARTVGAVCRTGRHAVVSSSFAHHGEERCLSGTRGSGTIFFAFCNLQCAFCQNWDLSWKGDGDAVTGEELAGLMLELQRQGCHNVNLVSPSHVVPQILEAVAIAAARGLRLPLVFNTGGYDGEEGLRLLDGVVDVYLADLKYGDSAEAVRYSRAPGYFEVAKTALREMHRQVGDLVVGPDGIARRGLLVRHLVLPGGHAGTEAAMRFLAEEISPRTYVNLMDQYRPCYRAAEHPEIDRRPSGAELRAAAGAAIRAGITRLDPDGVGAG